MRIISIFNQKGGVGKTSLAFHLGWYLSEIGHRTLLVDLDPQGNLSSLFGVQGCSAAHLFTRTGLDALQPVEVSRNTPTSTGVRAFSLITSDESLQPLEATTNGLAGLTKLRKALRSAASAPTRSSPPTTSSSPARCASSRSTASSTSAR